MLIAAGVGRHSEADTLELWNRRGLTCTPVLVDVVGHCCSLGHNQSRMGRVKHDPAITIHVF
jgi:hypothetical protein